MGALQRLDLDAYKTVPKRPFTLVLDNLRSGLNVGSIFRSADAFLVEKIWLCGITVQPPHREILKTALGSTESVEWAYVTQTADAIQVLRAEGYKIWALEQTSPKTWLQDFAPQPGEKHAFVIGNEVDGVDEQLLPLCDGAIEIPQYGTKHSLNVAVATGILLWQVLNGKC